MIEEEKDDAHALSDLVEMSLASLDAHALADLVEMFLASLDDEFDHGHYGPPDIIPPGHEDEEDYYEEHDKIVTKTANFRLLVQGLVDKIRGKHHA